RMRDVLRAIGGALRTAGGVVLGAVLAVARFWGAVFRAMLPDRERDEDEDEDAGDEALEIDERDVLELSDEEAASEPVIIGRPAKKKKRAPAELEVVDDPEAEAAARPSPALEVVATPTAPAGSSDAPGASK